MSFPATKPTEAEVFAPADGDKFKWQEGQRRQIEPTKGLPFRWPREFRDRKDYFETWHAISMKVIADHRGSFRTIGVLWRFINQQSGTMWPTDPLLAAVTGSSERSVSRDIKQYQALGILRVEHGWGRQKSTGKPVRTRTLIPTIPIELKGDTKLPVIEDHPDNSGLDADRTATGNHPDNSGQKHPDNSGLFTLEEPLKRSGGDETA